MTAKDASQIAAERWEEATGIILDQPIVTGKIGVLNCGNITCSCATGCWNNTTQTMTLRTDVSDEAMVWTAMHEWGHRAGLRHDVDGTVMASSMAKASKRITGYDIDQMCSIHVCTRWVPGTK